MMVEGCHGKSGTQEAPGERDTTSVRTDSKHSNTGQLNKLTSQFCYFSKSVSHVLLQVVIYMYTYQFSFCVIFKGQSTRIHVLKLLFYLVSTM